jgi:hypothetical protein
MPMRLTTFVAFRRNKEIQVQALSVQVLDAGPENAPIRNTVIVMDDQGRAASTEPAERMMRLKPDSAWSPEIIGTPRERRHYDRVFFSGRRAVL